MSMSVEYTYGALNCFTLPDLPPSVLSSLPPLPTISDSELLRVATTHASVAQKVRVRYDLSMNDEILDYEKLEHVGDAILGSVITVLLHDLFPLLREGPATMLKGHLVSNRTLAQIASGYGLPKKLITAQAALYSTREQVKTRGSMLEAWVAAVFYSYLQGRNESSEAEAISKDEPVVGSDEQSQTAHQPISGGASVSDETIDKADKHEAGSTPMATDNGGKVDSQELALDNKDGTDDQKLSAPPQDHQLTGNSLLKIIKPFCPRIATEPMERTSTTLPPPQADQDGADSDVGDKQASPSQNRGSAYLFIDQWLRPVFTPIAHFALDEMRKEQARLAELTTANLSPTDKSTGAASFISVHCTQHRWADPVMKSQRGNGDSWVSTCIVTDGEGKLWTAQAVRHNKKLGINAAAYDVCKQMGLLQVE